jgi:hypothetical protein
LYTVPVHQGFSYYFPVFSFLLVDEKIQIRTNNYESGRARNIFHLLISTSFPAPKIKIRREKLIHLGGCSVEALCDVDGGFGDGVWVALSHLLNIHSSLRGGDQYRPLHNNSDVNLLAFSSLPSDTGTVLNPQYN